MYLLDTDVVSNVLDENRNYITLNTRLQQTDPRLLFISVITVEEIIRGMLVGIRKAQIQSYVVTAYQKFWEVLKDLEQFQTLQYTDAAQHVFQSLPSQIKRIGTQDCRIAAIAHTTGMTIITANVADFHRINLAPIQDWTQ